jgi:predicted alpha/beta hydrolase
MIERSRSPSPADDRREPFEVACADGWRLRGELVVGAPPVAVAVVGHAMMVDRRTLDRPRGRGLVSHLAARGIACVWADLRGHGKSGPRPEAGGDWGYDDLVEQDVPALLGVARARFPGLPLATVGHSLFGHVALAHVARHPAAPVDGLVLRACSAANPEWRNRPRTWVVKRALIEVMGLATRLAGRLPVRRLGYGTDDEAAGYVADFVRCARGPDWRARDGFGYWDALPSVRRPLLALVGAGDRIMSPPADARGLAERVPGARVEVVGRHSGLPFDPDHMGLVLDGRARPAWERAAEFIRSLRPAVPAAR